MSKFLRERYRKLESYVPGEQPKDRTFVKLNTNESPYPPGTAVLDAVSRQEAAALRLYPDPECGALKDSLAKLYGVKRANVFVANGSDDILNFAFMAFAGGRTKAMFPEISYGFYPVFARLHSVEFEAVPLQEDFSLNPEDYVCKNSLIVIANPNAPTGKALDLCEIEKIVRTNRDNVVLIDEAYVDFGAQSCVELIHKYDNLLVVQTFSKSRSMAGARLGFAFSSEGIISDLEKLKFSTNPYSINRLTMAAGIAAVEENDYYRENCRKIMDTREYTAAGLRQMGFAVVPSSANFLFVRSRNMSGEELQTKLREKGYLVRRFSNEKIADYNRVTIGTREDMEGFLQAVSEIMEER